MKLVVEQAQVEPAKKTNKVKKGNYTKATRNSRTKTDAPTEKGPKRNNTEETLKLKSLKGKFETITIKAGSLNKCNKYKAKLSTAATYINKLKRLAQLGTQWMIQKLIKEGDEEKLLDDLVLGNTKGHG